MTFKRAFDQATLFLACIVLLTVGCSKAPVVNNNNASHHHGQHGGHLVEMMGDSTSQIEFTLDDKNRQMVIYILDNTGEKPYPLAVDNINAIFIAGDQTLDTAFTAYPLIDDPAGSSSPIQVKH